MLQNCSKFFFLNNLSFGPKNSVVVLILWSLILNFNFSLMLGRTTHFHRISVLISKSKMTFFGFHIESFYTNWFFYFLKLKNHKNPHITIDFMQKNIRKVTLSYVYMVHLSYSSIGYHLASLFFIFGYHFTFNDLCWVLKIFKYIFSDCLE